jgi:hypothetical protein
MVSQHQCLVEGAVPDDMVLNNYMCRPMNSIKKASLIPGQAARQNLLLSSPTVAA